MTRMQAIRLLLIVFIPWEIGGAVYAGTHEAGGWCALLTMAAVFSILFVGDRLAQA